MSFTSKKTVITLSVASCIIFIICVSLFSARAAKTYTMEELDTFLNEYGEEYYAYMVLDEAEESLKPIILEARWRIISRESWVADDIDGMVQGGGISETVPHFHEIFPADWEIQPGRGTY